MSTSVGTITTATPVPAQLAGDRDATLRFLKLLWPEGPKHNYICVWRGGVSKWFGGATGESGSLLMLEVAADFIAAHPVNAYVGMCLADRDHGPHCRLSRSEERLAHASHGVWMDVDLLGAAHKSENYPKSLQQVVEILHRAGLANFIPTFAIFTGGGWHLYWLFREPWFFEPGSDPRFHDRDIFCSLLRRWQKLIRDAASAMNLTLDPTHDPERVLRPAGTIRAKEGCEPNATSFFDELSSGRRYAQSDMTELLDMLGVVEQLESREASPVDVGPLRIDPNASVDGELFESLGKADPVLVQILNLQKPLGKTLPPEDSFSERDQQLAGYLAFWVPYDPETDTGFDAQRIVDALIWFRRTKAKPGHQRQKHGAYYAITTRKALDWAKSEHEKEDRRKSAESRKQAEAEESAKLEQQQKQATESEAAARKLLADIFKPRQITRMLILSDNGAVTYRLEVDGTVVKIGGVGAIFSSELTSRAIWQATGRPLPPIKKKHWISVILPAFHQIRQEVNMDENNGRIRRWLHGYFKGGFDGCLCVRDPALWVPALEEMVTEEDRRRSAGVAMLYGDYICLLRAHKFTSWVRKFAEDGNEECATSIREKLLALGFERKDSHTITFEGGEKFKLRDVFVGQIKWFQDFQSGDGDFWVASNRSRPAGGTHSIPGANFDSE